MLNQSNIHIARCATMCSLRMINFRGESHNQFVINCNLYVTTWCNSEITYRYSYIKVIVSHHFPRMNLLARVKLQHDRKFRKLQIRCET